MTAQANDLVEGFTNPPDSVKPHTFWHWMNGNVTKEGISADLEAMKDVGIGGVMLFVMDGDIPESVPVYIDKPVHLLTPEWFAMLRHAATECKRLGMEMSLMNCPGWATSGGPWVPPEKSIMRIAWSEIFFKGPGRVEGLLPKPPCDYAQYQNLTKMSFFYHESAPPEQRFYQDAAVLAYHLDPSAARIASLWPPQLTCSEAGGNPAQVVDGDGSTAQNLGANGFVELDFGEAVVVRGVEYLGKQCELQAGDDGKKWQKVIDLPNPRLLGYPQTIPVPATKARYFRLYFPAGGSVNDVKLSGDSMLLDYPPKASFHGYWEDSTKAEERLGRPTPNWVEATIKSKEVLNLTDRLKADGTLDWNAPSGDWMIVRLGCAPIGRLNGPCGRKYQGLECNKLDAEAVEYHFNQFAGRVAEELKDLVGSGFHAVNVDSWEAGDLNFTPKFIAEFNKRRGYDPMPFLLVHGGGRVVDGPAVSERFLWDVRRTIADLLADNYYGKLHDLCNKRGIKFQGEIAGLMIQTTIDQLQAKGRCDLPMGEFWLGPDDWARWDLAEASSGAHIHGKRIVGAEAFTTFDNWMTDLYGMKAYGDLAFALGINRLVFHSYAHDPWPESHVPGMTMGPFGVNFSRKNTWWGRPVKAWIDYLRRCQFMLQEGLYVADILYFYGEGAPNTLPRKPLIEPTLPDGYSYDGCDAQTLLTRVEVKDGRLMLPDGMSYRVLVLKNDTRMTPELLTKIRDLVKAGAIVIGSKPTESPSLNDYPRCDEKVRTLADEVWGKIDGKTMTENNLGSGRVVWGSDVGKILKSIGLDTDCDAGGQEGGKTIAWIHRRTSDADIFFISNQQNFLEHGLTYHIWEKHYDSLESIEPNKDTVKLNISFRVDGKQPELWDAVTGTRRDLSEFCIENNRTVVPLTLPPLGSCFVVFRRPFADQANSPGRKNYPDLKKAMEIEGPWTVAFDPKCGGPEQITFDRLEDWIKRPEPGIKFYSGRATYKKTFNTDEAIRNPGKRVYLDLGTLHSLAEIRLNGKDLGVIWCAPWRVDVTGLLKPKENKLEIDIVNVWANRLIGDTALLKEKRLSWSSSSDSIKPAKPDHKLAPSGLRGPVVLYVEEL